LPKFFLIFLQGHTAIGYVIQVGPDRTLDSKSLLTYNNFETGCRQRWVWSLGDRGVMRSIPFKRLARLGTGAFLILLAHGLYAPGSAWAACNHLVTARSDPSFNLARLDALILGDSLKSPREQPAPARRMPCSGLSCSSQVPTPASTTSPEPDGTDQWGIPGVRFVIEVASPPVTTNDQPVPHSATEKTSIFHRPRVGPVHSIHRP
jgi:hypothetical protein